MPNLVVERIARTGGYDRDLVTARAQRNSKPVGSHLDAANVGPVKLRPE
jgi:hypothetical protein